MLPAALIAGFAVAACATRSVPDDSRPLPYEKLDDLIDHPRKWDGAILTLKIYPFDNGYRESYRVCFEACGREGGDRSGVVIYTAADRFKGYAGDRPVVVRVKYSSACSYRAILCPEGIGAQLTELPAQ